jgi:hypothetical protein
MEDIAPYTCIIEDCPKPDVIYTHRHDWEQHVERDHPSCWECVPCKSPGHAPVLFVSADDLLSHTAQLHNDSIEESQYTTLLVSSKRAAPSGISQWPLCDETGEGDGDALFNHIMEHVHLFSLHSLPWLKDDDADIVDDDPYDYFQHNDYFHLGSSMRSSEYIQFSDPNQDSSEHNSNRSAVKDDEDSLQSIEDRPYSNAPRTTGLTASTLISLQDMVDNGGESNKILSQWLRGHREAEDLEETPLDTERRDDNPEADPRLVMPVDNTDLPLASTVPLRSALPSCFAIELHSSLKLYYYLEPSCSYRKANPTAVAESLHAVDYVSPIPLHHVKAGRNRGYYQPSQAPQALHISTLATKLAIITSGA